MNLILIVIFIYFFFLSKYTIKLLTLFKKVAKVILILTSYYDYLHLLLKLVSLNHIYTWYLFVLYFLWMRIIMQLGMRFNML